MVFSPMKSASYAAFIALAMLLATVRATPLEYNPCTQVGDLVCLGHDHPAYGAALTRTVYEVEVKLDQAYTPISNSSLRGQDSDDKLLRKLEATSQDVQRLETHFGQPMERNVAKLVSKATFNTIPWPSSYWPVFQDSINYKWNRNQPSPAEKYAKAFGLNVQQFMDGISRNNGILSQSNGKTCSSNSDCAGSKDGSQCAKRDGQTKGYCIPGWFGICHAWAPAAILEQEPKCPVTKNGVTFQPFDIKALLSLIYDGASVETVFTGARYNGGNEAKDKYGRHTDAAYRDLGPGFFHIAITNIMGRFKKSFVVDVTAGAQVWNQPVYSYEITDVKLLTPSQAAQQYYSTNQYPFNNQAQKLMYVKN